MWLSDKDKFRTALHINGLKESSKTRGGSGTEKRAYGRHTRRSLSGNRAEFWLEQEAIIGVIISCTVFNCNQCRCLQLSGRKSSGGERVQLTICKAVSFSTWFIFKGVSDTQARKSQVLKSKWKPTTYDNWSAYVTKVPSSHTELPSSLLCSFGMKSTKNLTLVEWRNGYFGQSLKFQ